VPDSYARLPQTVTALQWQGGEDGLYAVEQFTQPSVVRYIPDGNLLVSTQDGTLQVLPFDWIVKDDTQAFSVFTNDAFVKTYTSSAAGASSSRR
jgi:hypothetical protein